MKNREALFTDERLEWLKDSLVLGLDLQEVPREQLVEVLTKYELADFLNGKTNHTAVVFVAVDHVETIQADPNAQEEEDEEETKNEAIMNEDINNEIDINGMNDDVNNDIDVIPVSQVNIQPEQDLSRSEKYCHLLLKMKISSSLIIL